MPRFRCSKSEPAPEPTAVPCSVSGCNVFDVVAKVCTVATNFLRLFKAGSGKLALALATIVLGWDCDAGEGKIYNASGLF